MLDGRLRFPKPPSPRERQGPLNLWQQHSSDNPACRLCFPAELPQARRAFQLLPSFFRSVRTSQFSAGLRRFPSGGRLRQLSAPSDARFSFMDSTSTAATVLRQVSCLLGCNRSYTEIIARPLPPPALDAIFPHPLA